MLSIFKRICGRQHPKQVLMENLRKWIKTEPNQLDAKKAEKAILDNYHKKNPILDFGNLEIFSLPSEIKKFDHLEDIILNLDYLEKQKKHNYREYLKKTKKTKLVLLQLRNKMTPLLKTLSSDYGLDILTGDSTDGLNFDKLITLSNFLKEPSQENIKLAFSRFVESLYYANCHEKTKEKISKKLLDCLWKICERKSDLDFINKVKNYCSDSLTDCDSRNHFFIFNLVNFVNIKPKSELNSLTPFQKFEFLKNQALFNYVKKNANDYIPKRYRDNFGEFRESVHHTLHFLQAFNGKFGQQLDLQLLDISSERGDSRDTSAVQKFLDSFKPVANAYQSKEYGPINKIISDQLADDYFEGFWGTYLTELDFIDKENLDKIIERQKQTRDREAEELDYDNPNYDKDILRIDKDFKLETKKLLATHFLMLLENLQSHQAQDAQTVMPYQSILGSDSQQIKDGKTNENISVALTFHHDDAVSTNQARDRFYGDDHHPAGVFPSRQGVFKNSLPEPVIPHASYQASQKLEPSSTSQPSGRFYGDDNVSAEIYFSSTSPIVNFFDGKTSYSHNSLPIGSPSVKTVASASESNPKSPRKSSDKSGGLFWA